MKLSDKKQFELLYKNINKQTPIVLNNNKNKYVSEHQQKSIRR